MTPAKGYTEMKESGIEWLGKIPNNWCTIRVKYAFRIKKVIAGELGHTVLSVTQRGIKPKDMSEKGQFSLDYSKYQLVSSGDFIMNHMDLLTGWVDISNMDGVTSPDYRVFQSSNPEKYYPDFYRYVFQTCYQQRIFYGLGQGVSGFGRWRLPAEIFLNFYLPVPPYESQSAIAAYLDTQCAKIDEIIAQAKASIEDYKQWKASIIYEAVTKGLDPNVEMKDSGIEWIGKIPINYKVIKLKYVITNIESGVSVNASQAAATDGKVGVLKTSAVSKYKFRPEENKEVNADELNRVACPVKANTVIVSRMNTPDLVGACGYVERDYPNLFLPDRLWQVHFNDSVIAKFVWYYLCSNYIKNYYSSLSSGTSSSMQNISQGQFENACLLLPSLKAQRDIVTFLDKKCMEIDSIIDEKDSLIGEIESYKKSLIYEVVTGKRRVC